MNASNSRKLRIGLMLVGLFCTAVLFNQQIIGHVAYAVEKGKLEAGQEELAKVEAISQAFKLVAKQVKPAVVWIQTVSTAKTSKVKPSDDVDEEQPFDYRGIPEPWRNFFKDYQRKQKDRFTPPPRQAQGSGVIIDAEKGYVLTNNHVLGDAEEENQRIIVHLPDERRRYDAAIVGRDPKTDLALLKIEAGRLHAVKLGDSDLMEVGDWVLAIGAPFNLPQTVTQGIISAKGRSKVNIIPGYEDFIQTDAAINPGNSGGPLVNMRGEVIGINTAIATSGFVQGYMGIGFAIPTNIIREVLPRLKEGKRIVRGYLGVGIKGLDSFPPGIGKSYGLDKDEGVLVESVFDNTPASKAGLKEDDVILAVDGKRINSDEELRNLIARTEPSTTLNLLVWRENKEITIPAKIEEQPGDFFTWGRQRGSGPGTLKESDEGEVSIETLGIKVSPLTAELAEKYGWSEDKETLAKKLPIISEVEPLGEASVNGIEPGDLIVSVQGEAVKSMRQLGEALCEKALAKGVRLRVLKKRYGSTSFFFKISPKSKAKETDKNP